jgi:hypothetical protein
MNTALVEGGSVVEPRHVVHGDLRTEAAIAEVGPIADFADLETDRLLSSVMSPISAEGERLPTVIPKMERWDPGRGEPSFPSFPRKVT